MPKECVLYDNKICTDCGECYMCDLDPKKKCNNCAKCLDEPDELRTVYLDDFMTIMEDKEEFKKKKK